LSNTRELVDFTRKLAYFTGKGLPLHETINNIKNDMKDRDLKNSADKLSSLIEAKKSFSKALESVTSIYPSHIRKIIQLGEEKGKLPETLEQISVFIEQEERTKNNIKSDYIIPVTLNLIFLFCIFVFLFLFIMPYYRNIFTGMNITLPLLTRLAISISHICTSPVFLMLYGVLLLLIVSPVFFGDPLKSGFIYNYIPLLGRKLQDYYTFHIAWTASMLLERGLSPDEAFDEIYRGIDMKPVKESLRYMVEGLKQNRNFSTIFERKGLFPGIFCWLAIKGENREDLHMFLKRAVNIYYKEENRPVETSDYREYGGVITLCTVLLMGFIVLALILPMYQLIGSIR